MENDNIEMVEISINYKGNDMTAVVTLEEANILLNDEAAAAKYAETFLLSQEAQLIEAPPLEDAQCSKQQTENNFSSRKATLLFLSLRTQYNDKFNDRKTLKQSLWQKIADAMNNHGYNVPEGREGAEKCRQKFANLQRSYVNYIKHMKTTGTERRDPPPYFDEMHAILGNKDKVNPPYLEDSLDTSSCDTNEAIASCSSASPMYSNNEQNSALTDKQKEIKNRFRCNTSLRPNTNFNQVVELFKEQHEQLRRDKQKHMNVFEEAIRVQNAQRAEFLKLLKQASKRKRRHNSSSSSSDE